MKRHIRRRMTMLGLAAAIPFVTLSGPGLTQEYPTRAIRLIVAFSAGGPTDALARLVAGKLTEKLGQTVLVENHPGAAGNIGYGLVAKAVPDGYTLAWADPSITVNASLFKNLPFDVERDFAPISAAVRGPTVLVVPQALEAKTVLDLVALAKRSPGKLSYGSAGSGTPPHLNAEFFKIAEGLNIVHVPYKGASPAITDLVAGRIHLMFLNIGSAKGQIDANALRGLAVSGTERAASLPNVPTFREAGLPLAELDAGTWWGVIGPAKLPADVQQKLNRAMHEALNDADLRRRLGGMNVYATPTTPEAFGKLIRDERRKWADVVQRGNVKVE
ncbi:MAG TPA: tripartite tricarboxylate transporter substrate binding protein [Methyloceanibacter sp.]|nr:tripartite tricarboxylate transporter substrate binding protein [Methyloceanibacter sp.]